MGAVKAADFTGSRIEAGESVVRAQPEPARAVAVDAVDGVVGQAVAIVEIVEADRFRGERAAHDTIETAAAGAHPHCALRVDIDRVDGRTAERAGIARIVLQTKEAAAEGIENVQATALGAHPETSC